MSGTSFIDKLRQAWQSQQSLVCVGLDPDPERMPVQYSRDSDGIAAFCEDIVDATHDLVCAYKPQIAYFAARGSEAALVRTIAYIHQRYPHIPVILDAKRGDIGSTAEQYAVEAFDRYGADAVTVNPYLGGDSLHPFLRRADRGVIILCRTSNDGAADFQDLVSPDSAGGSQPLYERIAVQAATRWNGNGNCALVVGATWPQQLAHVRSLVGDMPLLVPGVGAQGGDVEQLVRAGQTAQGGLIVNSSRAILYAASGDDAPAAARAATASLRDQINGCR